MISDLERMKKKMREKPWLYEEEEHKVLALAEEAIQFIKSIAQAPLEHYDTNNDCLLAKEWLKEHES